MRLWNDSRLRLAAVLLLLGTLMNASIPELWGQTPQTLRLWEGDAPHATAPHATAQQANDIPTIDLYLASKDDKETKRTAVVVCPGGGYGHLAMDHEGKQIAQWLNENGITAIVLNYRHRGKGYGHPVPLIDVQRAIRTVRSHADQWSVAADRIGVLGFSAGGHLASTAATHFDDGDSSSDDPVDQVSCRPDFAVLCYGVLTLGTEYTHQGSQQNLLGEDADPELVRSLSNEKQVTKNTPPTFLFHTDQDKGVVPENSVLFYLALRKHQVPAELHVFQKGPHGVGLAASIGGTNKWPALCIEWMQGQGVLDN